MTITAICVLTERSPAIGFGNTASLPADVTDSDGDGDTAEAVAIDPDGNARVFGGTVDIGAYEYQGTVSLNRETPSLTVTTGDDEFDLYDGGHHTPRGDLLRRYRGHGNDDYVRFLFGRWCNPP